MRASVFIGDIADAEAEAICTSTNPRLSLMMGTGAAVRSRGGYDILRACETIVSREGPLPPGSAWATTAGTLGSRVVIHCVASDANHRSWDATVALCVRNALECAAHAGCRTVAMPVFATGHAHVNFRRAVETMARTAREVSTTVEQIVFVIRDEDDLHVVREILGRGVPVTRSEPATASSWADENPFG
jgi:O-acetyl-ADP-ribose deacetylase (regulator of RNase III)